MKWSSQVVFEPDLPCGAANAFSVYMSVHAIVSDCVFVPVLLACSLIILLCALHNEYIAYIFIRLFPQSFSNLVTQQ